MYRRVSVGFSHRAPMLSIARSSENAACRPANETEEHTGSDRPCDALGISQHVHAAASRCIDGISRRLVPPIAIPPPPVCPQSVFPMVCPYPVRDEFDPHGSTQGIHGPAALHALHLARSHDQSNRGGRCQSIFPPLHSAKAPVCSSVWASVPSPPRT